MLKSQETRDRRNSRSSNKSATAYWPHLAVLTALLGLTACAPNKPATLDLLPANTANQVEQRLVVPAGAKLTVEWSSALDERKNPRRQQVADSRVPGEETVEVWLQTEDGRANLLGQAERGDAALVLEDPAVFEPFVGQMALLRVSSKGIRPSSIEWQTAELEGLSRKGDAEEWFPEPATGPDVVVYLVDTLRGDALGYAGGRAPTPHIDRLAAEGTVYTEAASVTSWTRTAVSSLFSGLYPSSHGVVDKEVALREGTFTLAERFRMRGYQTIGIIANRHVDSSWAFDQGFEVYDTPDNPWRDPKGRRKKTEIKQHNRAWEVHDKVFESLEKYRDPDRPLFLYVHTVDTHSPYAPPDWLLQEPRPELLVTPRLHVDVNVEGASSQMQQDLRLLYAGEVAYTDQEFGKFWSGLTQRLDPQELVFFLTSDHGEAFFEHGKLGHGITLFEEEVHIPFLLWAPGRVPAGERLDVPVSLVDAVPTLMGLAGQPAEPSIAHPLQGVNLAANWSPVDRPVTAELHLRGQLAQSLRRGPLKLIRGPRERAVSLYNLEQDPLEAADLAEEQVDTTGSMQLELEAWAAVVEQLELPSSGTPAPPMSPEVIENLRALGYLQ